MPVSNSYASAGTVDGKIYLIGGATELFGEGTSAVFEYGPATDTWTEKSPMPGRTAWAAAVVHEGHILVLGGAADCHGREQWTETGSPSSGVYEYDPVADTRTERDDMPFERWTMPAALVDGKVYLIGGSEGGWPFHPWLTEMWAYDPSALE
jgi:hypothetical protein